MIATLLVLAAGLVHLVPMSGVLSESRLRSLYGVPIGDPNRLILMRHRAVLFGIVGALLVTSALHSPLRPVGLAAGLVSMLSFVLIAWRVGGSNPELRRVVSVDVVASIALVAAWMLDRMGSAS